MNLFHDLSPLSADKGALFGASLDAPPPQNVTSRRRRLSYGLLIVCLLLNIPLRSGAAAQPSVNTWPLRMAAAVRAVDWLHTQQQADGSFGVRTADAVFMIARAGQDPDGPAWRPGAVSPLDVLRSQAPTYLTDAGRTAKYLRAAAAAGQDVHNFGGVDLVTRLNSFYDPAAGLYHPGHLFYHILALQSLHLADQPVPAPALAALLALQHPSGGWEWRIGGPLDEVDTTGLALETLPLAGVPISHSAVISAVNFLATAQHAEGGWSLNPTGTVNSNSTALALAGLRAVAQDPATPPFTQGGHTPLDVLLALQAADGGFDFMSTAPGERLMATLDALDALLRPYPGDELPPARIFLPFAPRAAR